MSSTANSKTINRRPGSIVMDLHVGTSEPFENILPLPLSPLAAIQTRSNASLQVGLTINFRGYQPIAIPAGTELGLPNGEVAFGFQRGRLQLFLENCKIPRSSGFIKQGSGQLITVDKPQPAKEAIRICQSHRHPVFKTLPKQKAMASEESRSNNIQIKRKGSEESPIWTFKTQGKQKTLEGQITEMALGTLHYSSLPYKLTARFTVQREDIRLNWGKSLATQQIPRNKLAIIQRILNHEYIGPQIDSCPLSEVSWPHE